MKSNLEVIDEIENGPRWLSLDELDYEKRKFIMPIDDKKIAGCVADGIITMRRSHVPSCISFPVGHPVSGELYIGHPFNSSLYVPFADSVEYFFVDKIHELSYLLQALGAEEISITSVKGKNYNEMLNSSQERKVKAAKIASGSVDEKNLNDSSLQSNSIVNRQIFFKFDPVVKPYVPENLIWLNSQPEWKRLVQNRLAGNMLQYSETVSTSQTKFTTETEDIEIEASVNFLITKIKGKTHVKSNTRSKQQDETEWRVDVKFRSIKDFEDSSDLLSAQIENKMTVNEQEYLEELKECFGNDRSISDGERRMLNRYRQRLGISDQRAEELEKQFVSPVLTDEEKEYLEIFKELAEEGEITERKRRMLNRECEALGISNDRARELESMV